MWTLQHDYRDLGMDVEVVHHTALLKDLIADGRLTIPPAAGNGSLVYHDPCYLGRYAGEFQAPRELVRESGYNLIEPERTNKKSFCCGGGGGRAFLEETEGDRVNHLRVQELAETKASTATACPYCRFMLRDALSDKGLSEEYNVFDVAETLAERLSD